MAWAACVGGRRLGLLAMAIAAASPFAILFSPTAFTDPWLSLWLACAALAALARRPLLSGLCVGLAIASKQTGILGLPLVALLLWAGDEVPAGGGTVLASPKGPRVSALDAIWGRGRSISRGDAPQAPRGNDAIGSARLDIGVSPRRPAAQMLGLALLGLALVLAPVVWWDSLRWATRPSFWYQSLQTYGGLGLASPAAWPQRAAAWGQQIGYLFGRPPATAAMLLLAALGAVTPVPGDSMMLPSAHAGDIIGGDVCHSERVCKPACAAATRQRRIRLCVTERVPCFCTRWPCPCSRFILVATYVLAYLAVHFFLTFQPWDRYLLPLVPLLAVLAAQGALGASGWLHAHLRASGPAGGLAAGGLAALLLWGAMLGATGALPVGSDYGAFAGVDQVVATLRSLPWSAVVYERSLGWHLDFYMFDSPPPHIWWDQPATLADDAEYGVTMMPQRQQWLVLATSLDEQAGQQAAHALAARGLMLVERRRIGPAGAGQACACPAGDHRCQCPLPASQTNFVIYQNPARRPGPSPVHGWSKAPWLRHLMPAKRPEGSGPGLRLPGWAWQPQPSPHSGPWA